MRHPFLSVLQNREVSVGTLFPPYSVPWSEFTLFDVDFSSALNSTHLLSFVFNLFVYF